MPDRSDGRSLRSGFLIHAEERPDALAVVVRGVSRSYLQIANRARRWASALISVSGGRPERIGLFAYRSERAYTGTLATLLAGAAFVPLNPTFPPAKTAAMISSADLDAVIVDASCVQHLPGVPAAFQAALSFCLIPRTYGG
jgi:non-ribosomal peptide synthetase component F